MLGVGAGGVLDGDDDALGLGDDALGLGTALGGAAAMVAGGAVLAGGTYAGAVRGGVVLGTYAGDDDADEAGAEGGAIVCTGTSRRTD